MAHLPALPSIDWLDQDAYVWSMAAISLAYDGLVDYRRVGGAAGSTLVGALATTFPRPAPTATPTSSRCGPGLRYSDGSPSARGLPRLDGALPPGDARPLRAVYTASSARRRACTAGPLRSVPRNRIRPPARTITIHLTRPDPDFMHKLAPPFAYVVPADTPQRRTGDRAPPGTGPYRFAAWNTGRGGTLVRNRYFRAGRPATARRLCRPHRGRCPPRSRDRWPGRRRPTRSRRSRSPRQSVHLAAPARAPSGALAPSPGQLHSRARGDPRVHVPQRAPAAVRRRPGTTRRSLRDRPSAPRRARRRLRDSRPDVPDPAEDVPAYQPYCPTPPGGPAGGGWSCARRRAARAA